MKKLLAILGMITCMIALAACGAADETQSLSDEEKTQLITAGEINVNALYQVIASDAVEQYAGNEVIYNGLQSFQSALEDMGNYIGASGGEVEVNGEETIIRINMGGTDHDAVAEMIINSETTDFMSLAVNVIYTFEEQMEKAGLNTLLGMGTVFVILILISLIISAFGLISKAQKSEKKADAPEKKVDNVVAQIMEKEELSDDLELVAVISAAIAAYEGSGSTDGFVVRSIRKARR
ncbi:MAG: OadG family protein [Lachnospiraceae bacterium]|nr:OadG family protein [Lachnospiraceae bacterium]